MEMYQTDDWDEYEDDGEDEEAQGEYEEEQEDPKPTKEELEFLELRQKLKEIARKKMKKENGASLGNSQLKKKKFAYDNYGSFFGPSQPVIAQRVIQESKSFAENQHLAARILNSSNSSKKAPASKHSETKPVVRIPPPKVFHETQTKHKAQMLKDNRDYSFLLSDDSELPAPRKEPSSRNIPMRTSDTRSAEVQSKSRHSVSNLSRPLPNGCDERKSGPTNRQMQNKASHHQVGSGSRRYNTSSADSRKQLGSNTGNVPGRPMGPKGLPNKMPAPTKSPVLNKVSSLTIDKKPSLVGAKKPSLVSMQKTSVPRLHPSATKQHAEQKRVVREPEKAKLNSKISVVSSKPQGNPHKQIESRPPMQVGRLKKRPAGPYSGQDEDEYALAQIRNMFRYDPRKYTDIDDDVSDMEANFDDILREEKISERIAKEEDEREARLIEEEERRERMRKEAKKRKLSQR